MTDLGTGLVKPEGAWFRDSEPDSDYVVFSCTDDLLNYLRNRFGDFVLDVTEGFMREICRFAVYQRPF